MSLNWSDIADSCSRGMHFPAAVESAIKMARDYTFIQDAWTGILANLAVFHRQQSSGFCFMILVLYGTTTRFLSFFRVATFHIFFIKVCKYMFDM